MAYSKNRVGIDFHPYKVLRDHNISQVELAKRLNITPAAVQKFMKNTPSQQTIARVCVAIGANVVEFFTEKSRDELIAAGIIRS